MLCCCVARVRSAERKVLRWSLEVAMILERSMLNSTPGLSYHVDRCSYASQLVQGRDHCLQANP